MEVILLERISRLGELGDKVKVKSGFGRNYLIPTGRALPATPANLEYFEEQRSELEAVAAARLTASEARLAKFENLVLTIEANASDEGKLFGSVGVHEIIEAAKAMGHGLTKSDVKLEAPIREVGEYTVTIQLLGDEITTTIQVSVVPT